ncbi:hypothetical protein OV079_10185 [Nannocystis pusilla]|uniref:Uncharacterized protein n=1 Tax=Nannocystis pusilla TaxID=889268 RepID=A0A9X3EUT1_9BACT|nr:hypothetical protein [Nannocystis pusilla]MCY1005928.1 hypothetical protein [Nannocystis pusilla]
MSAFPETELRKLLVQCFSRDELEIFLADTYGSAVLCSLTPGQSFEGFVFGVIQYLRRMRTLDAVFFDALEVTRPNCRVEVGRLRTLFEAVTGRNDSSLA